MQDFNDLPDHIITSSILQPHHLRLLLTLPQPAPDAAFQHFDYAQIVQYFSLNPTDMETELHKLAARLLDEGKVADAWQVLL